MLLTTKAAIKRMLSMILSLRHIYGNAELSQFEYYCSNAVTIQHGRRRRHDARHQAMT